MAGNTIGEAWIAIKPDTTGFDVALSSAVGSALAKVVSGNPYAAAFAAVVVAIVAVGSAAADMSAKLQASLKAIQADEGLTAAQAKAIGDAFLSTMGKVTFSADTITAAFAPVSKELDMLNGGVLTAAQSLAFMNQAMIAAEATGAPLADTTSALASVMIAYNLPLKDAADATNLLVNASIDLNQPISSLTGVIDKLHGKLGEASPSLKDVTGLMVDLASNGVPARLVVSDLSSAITSLILPSKNGAKEIGALHLAVLNSHGAFVGMDSIIAQLYPKFQKLTPAQQLYTAALLFGKPAAAAMVSIIDKGPAAFDALTKSLDKTGSAQAIATTKTDTLAGAWSKFTSAISDVLTVVGSAVLPALTAFVKGIIPVVSSIVGWVTSLHGLWAVMGTVMGDIKTVVADVTAWIILHWNQISGTTLTIFGVIARVISIAWTLITTTIKVALGIIIPIVTVAWNGIAAATKLAWSVITGIIHVAIVTITAIVAAVNAIIGILAAIWNTVTTAVKNFVTGVVNFFKALPGNIVGALGNLGKLLFNAGKAVLQGFLDGLMWIWNHITGFIGNIANWISQHKGPLSADAALLYPHGQAIMSGLNAGLQSGIPPVLKTLAGLSGSMGVSIGGLSPGRGSAVALGGGSGPVSIVQHFHIPGGDPIAVQQVVAQENRKLVLALRAGRR
jgi:TP901 family phage tail tape measure protein